MATGTITPTVDPTKTDVTERHELYFGSLAFSAATDTYASGGVVLSFADPEIKSSQVPIHVDIKGKTGHIYAYVPGTTIADGKVMIFVSANSTTAALTEFGNGTAFNAASAPASDTITFKARFRKIQ